MNDKLVTPTWESTPDVLRAWAAHEYRQLREQTRPSLPSDGSVGQYNQWTELMARSITEPDEHEMNASEAEIERLRATLREIRAKPEHAAHILRKYHAQRLSS